MKYQYKTFFITAIALLFMGAGCLGQGTDNQSPTTTDNNGQEQPPSASINMPAAGASVSSPITITGQVPGSWATEGQLLIELRDSDNSLVTSTVVSVNNWMTTDLQAFNVQLSYNLLEQQAGKIVVVKGNPSGLPENDDSIEQSVTLQASMPNASGVFTNWEKQTIASLGIEVAFPEQFEQEQTATNTINFRYIGQQQTSQTELFDGISVSMFSREKGSNESLRDIVQEQYQQDDESLVGQGASSATTVNIDGEVGFYYRYTSLGIIHKYFFLNNQDDVIELHVLDPDAQNLGYAQVRKAIIESIQNL